MKTEYPIKLTAYENENLEYKLTVNKDSLSKEVVALANKHGGQIMIGIADDGTVVGTNGLAIEDVSNIIRDGCVPPLTPKIDRCDYDGKIVITVSVKSNQDVPYMTKNGRYYIRVGPTVRIASLLELIDLIIKGPYKNTIFSKMQIPYLETAISASMHVNTRFEKALTDIAILQNIAENATNESIKMEVIATIKNLLDISCKNDTVTWRILMILAIITSNNLVQSVFVLPPSKEIFSQIIAILQQKLLSATQDPQVTDQTRDILITFHMVGLGCIWAGYTEHLKKILEVIDSQCGRDHKLTKICKKTVDRLVKCVKEEPTDPPRRVAMIIEPMLDEKHRNTLFSLFHR